MAYDHSVETGAPSAASVYLSGDAGERPLVTRLTAFIALGFLFSTLTACTPMQARPTIQADPGAPTTTHSPNELDSVLQYYTRIRQLSGAALRKEQDVQRQAFAKDKSDLVRIQFALALSVPNNTDVDDARVVTLLDPLVKDAGTENASLRNLALLVTTLVGDNRKLNDSVMSLKQKLKDEQKETDALEQKLEALKSLEKRPSKPLRPEK